jgi:carboxymethylenebutenolidase
MAGMIEYAANGGTAKGYLAGEGNAKGIIVIQEWWGLAPHIKDVADRFAAAGFVALAPDLWDGKLTKAPDEAQRMYMALNVDDAGKKLRGAAAALHAHGAAGKLGVIGFCMGGALSLYAASKMPDEIGACITFYGGHPKVKPDWAALRAPVLGVYGESDGSITPALARSIEKSIVDAGGTCETHIYPAPAGHAFFNDNRPEAYHKASAEDAWRKTLAFLGRNL